MGRPRGRMTAERSAISAVALLAMTVAGCVGEASGGLPSSSPTTIRAVAAAPSPTYPGQPHGLTVAFPWPQDGYCMGQFTVMVTERANTVRVGDVVDQLSGERGKGYDCAGLGSDGRYATTYVPLKTPLGSRKVLRDRDDSPVPVVTSPTHFAKLFPVESTPS